MSPRPLIAATALLLAAGCTMGPDYARPDLAMPPAFRAVAPQGEAASVADLPWWELFEDPKLQALVVEAIANNRDLRAAIARIEQARGIRQTVRSEFFPQLGFSGAVSDGKNEFGGSPSPNGGETRASGYAVLNAFWEIDLWGRVRRADEAALARILATEEAWRGLVLSLVSEVATIYFELIGLDDALAISRRTVESFRESEDLFGAKADGGISSDLPVLRARAERAVAEASIPDLERQIAQLENAMALLLARPPQPVPRGSLGAAPPTLPLGAPAELLERRPDLRQAEAILRAANAEIGVAEADFLPRVGLGALLGGAAPDLDDITRSGSGVWSVSAQLSAPLLTFGRLEGQLAAAKARWDEAVANFDQTFFAALRDVADATVAQAKAVEVEQTRSEQVLSLQTAVSLSSLRYDLGRASYFELLDAQQRLFPAELGRSRALTDQFVATVAIYRALGGGWRLPDDGWIPADLQAADASGG